MLYLARLSRRYGPHIKCDAPMRSLQTQTNSSAERLRILFMGRDEFSCLVLQELYKAKDVWSELSIVTQPNRHVGRGSLAISPLKILGNSLDIPIHTIPRTRMEFRSWPLPEPFVLAPNSKNHPAPNHLLVTASFGRILTGAMLDAFQPAHRLNVHPSLLPAYRGPAPIQHAIMNDDKETGVSIIKMLKRSEGIDAGALWACRRTEIPDDATFASLRDKLGVIGGELLVSVLRDLQSGKAAFVEQGPVTDAPKAPLITAEDALIDFNTMTASQIDAKWRGIGHHKSLYTYTPDRKPLRINALSIFPGAEFLAIAPPTSPGQVVFSKKHELLIAGCADGTLLGVARVKPEGKAEMTARGWWNGAHGTFRAKEGAKEVSLGVSVDRLMRKISQISH